MLPGTQERKAAAAAAGLRMPRRSSFGRRPSNCAAANRSSAGCRRAVRRSSLICTWGMVSTSWAMKSFSVPCIRAAMAIEKPTPERYAEDRHEGLAAASGDMGQGEFEDEAHAYPLFSDNLRPVREIVREGSDHPVRFAKPFLDLRVAGSADADLHVAPAGHAALDHEEAAAPQSVGGHQKRTGRDADDHVHLHRHADAQGCVLRQGQVNAVGLGDGIALRA